MKGGGSLRTEAVVHYPRNRKPASDRPMTLRGGSLAELFVGRILTISTIPNLKLNEPLSAQKTLPCAGPPMAINLAFLMFVSKMRALCGTGRPKAVQRP